MLIQHKTSANLTFSYKVKILQKTYIDNIQKLVKYIKIFLLF